MAITPVRIVYTGMDALGWALLVAASILLIIAASVNLKNGPDYVDNSSEHALYVVASALYVAGFAVLVLLSSIRFALNVSFSVLWDVATALALAGKLKYEK